MKNAMKKIMGLLLVAVLLVSVVPFQALAEEKDLAMDDSNIAPLSDGGNDDEIDLANDQPAATPKAAGKTIQIYDNGSWVTAATVADDGSITFSTDYTLPVAEAGYVIKFKSDDNVYSKLADVPDGATVGILREKIAVTYKIQAYVDKDWVAELVVDENGTVKSGSLPTPTKDGYTFTGWTFQGGAPYTIGMKVTGDCTIGANFVKNGDSTTPTTPAGNYTLTINVGGDYPGTATMSVAPGTKVSASAIKDAVKSQLKISDNFTLDRTDPVTVNANLTIYVEATKSTSSSGSSDNTTNKFPYKVYLHVYLNNNIGEPDRNINITNTLATDGVVSMSEVKNLIPEYYKAKNSNGIGYDGLYLAKGNWVKDYVTDANKYTKMTNVDVRQGVEYVHINVMITNATAKTSSTADTSNPKTGDAIFMTITVMGLSAAALTGLYFYDRKRKVL